MFLGDFRKADIEPASADVIFTDPPYAKDALPLWEDLAEFALMSVAFCGDLSRLPTVSFHLQ